ncbi:hypothetical protein [Pseudanabaena sp. PCC 6802]|uniref:hypothetical protein n=1 Tax=Pseudanabaena sp. PCC 6802 TaxID=118173 RepID=UPI000348E994|nr:hypothetical protein [Pseudanabaena sp. PCC 6802]
MRIQQTINRNVQILQPMPINSSDIVTIYRPGVVSPQDRVATARFYGFITSLRLLVDIKSLPESQIPDLDVATSRADRLMKLRDVEWRSERKELQLLLKTSATGWVKIASVSLLNRVPFYHMDIMPFLTNGVAFELANNAVLGARIINAGYGLLQNGDEVVLYGSAKEEITSLPTDSPEISYATSYDFEIPTHLSLILPANPNRQQVTLTNKSDLEDVYISYSADLVVGKGICLKRGGGSYEINLSNLYRGNIYAIAANLAQLSGIEAV